MFKKYYHLAKPGIVYGNLMTTIAGLFLASKGHPDFRLICIASAGISLVVASGCVFNNYIDRKIDALMERTKNRELVRKTISERNAIVYGIFLGVSGFVLLFLYTNLLTVLIAFVGMFVYVVLYSIFKRRSVHGTVVGSISGAVPPLAGYIAVSNHIDAGAIILFMIVVLWQMPHFYAISIRRADEYAAAGIPVLPLKKGIRATKLQMLYYTIAFIFATIMLFSFGYAGYGYLAVAEVFGLVWLSMCMQGFWAGDDANWAHTMFALSLAMIMALCAAIILRF